MTKTQARPPRSDADERKLLESVKRNKTRYSAITAEFAEFPYTGDVAITYDMWVNAMTATEYVKDSEATIKQLDAMTGNGFSRLVSIFGDDYRAERTTSDFKKVIDALRAGTKNDIGEVAELDRFGCPNIAAYMAGCRESVSVSVEEIGSIDLETFIAPWHSRMPNDGEFVTVTNQEHIYMNDGEEWAILPYGLLWSWDMFKVLTNLCAAGFEQAIRTTIGLEQADSVALAQYSVGEMFQIHDFALKTLNEGLLHIAMGNTSYDLTPKRGGSKERYRLTASVDACTDFLVKGGNPEILKAVVGTVYKLRKDTRAAEFIQNGRVWFTLNKIVEEYTRTTGGTIRGRDAKLAKETIDAALTALSGSQIVGKDSSGSPTNVVYFIDAVRLERAECNGAIYHDVWGFAVDTRTIAEYALREGKKSQTSHAYNYPLVESDRPFTIDTRAINEYLSDALNELRGHLYGTSRSGNPTKKRTKKFTIKRAWQTTGNTQGIFERFSPTRTLTSRQKNKLVAQFGEVLTDLAKQEAHSERREGRPLYIYAWSERAGNRGRGKGAYVNLVIEASSEFHAIRDGSPERGAIDLQSGIESKLPKGTNVRK